MIDIGAGIPSYTCITPMRMRSRAMRRSARTQDIVPIVEPEVLMDGDHDIDRCYEVTEWVLKTVFEELYDQRVTLEGIVLKPNMVIAGKKAAEARRRRGSRGEDRASCSRLRAGRRARHRVPVRRPVGRGGDRPSRRHEPDRRLPWKLTFSYGRALQAAPQKAWAGKTENVAAAQRAFSHRATMNGLAALGQWKQDLEKKAA